MAYFIGIDSSTTATKALLMDETGRVIGVASAEYGYETPRPQWSQQHPDLWWQGTITAIRQVLKDTGVEGAAVQAIGLTGQMHGLVLLDEQGEVLRPAILWNDQRTQSQCDTIHNRLGQERLIQITGNVALTGFTAPKLLWVQEEEPEIYARIATVLLPKDYVRYRLTGKMALDKADGAGTILFDLKARDWSPEVLAALGINPAWLPPTFEGTEITGEVTADAAALTGLRPGIPVMAGGGDQAANGVGTGAVQDGVVALSLGTSGVVFVSTSSPVIEPQGRLHAFCHAVPGQWHLMGVMLSAAGSLRWHRDALAPGMAFDALVDAAAPIPPGSDGLFFLPYLTGERTPHPDPLARGAFIGLTVRHNLPHMTRAVLEGVAFGLRDSFELIQQAGAGQITQVRASGGGARSSLWRQILADVFQAEIVTLNTTEGAAYGAALLAAVGGGAFADVAAACQATIYPTNTTKPGAAAEQYQKSYALYRTLYPALQATFQAIGQ